MSGMVPRPSLSRRLKDLRPRLESARLELLALFRTLDQLHLAPQQIPQELLRELFELDADFAEALWALDQPRNRIRVKAMLRDTLNSLEQLSARRQQFLGNLSSDVRSRLEEHLPSLKASLDDTEAYHGIPGRDSAAPLPIFR
jgi:hypothetical protein